MDPEQAPLSLSDIASSHVYTVRCRRAFHCAKSRIQAARQQRSQENIGGTDHASTVLWLGLAIKQCQDHTFEIGMACHDGTYTTDFAVHVLHKDIGAYDPLNHAHTSEEAGALSRKIEDLCIHVVREYSQKNACKFLGAGLQSKIAKMSPRLSVRLWAELDIVPMVLDKEGSFDGVDEIADSMVRKCIMLVLTECAGRLSELLKLTNSRYFGPTLQPRLMVGRSNNVEVDVSGKAGLTSLDQYASTVGDSSFCAFTGYARSMRKSDHKLAFFSATPQGGGVALMRHALLRILHLADVKCTWSVSG
jgi:hypothetical protein